jgi:DNA replication protein DnaC
MGESDRPLWWADYAADCAALGIEPESVSALAEHGRIARRPIEDVARGAATSFAFRELLDDLREFHELRVDTDGVIEAYIKHRRERVSAGERPLAGSAWLASTTDPRVEAARASVRERRAEKARIERRRTRGYNLRGSGILPFLDADDERRLLEGDVDGVTFEPTRVVRAWLDKARTTHDAPPMLALLGDVGTGKTFAAALVIAEFGGQYVKAEELARLSLARFGQEHATFERLLACEVLVVDELALNLHRAEDERHALHTVIDARRQHATILVGNGNRETLREHLNERTYDRFEKLGVAATVAGPSRREASKRAGWSASARDRSDARSAAARSPHSIPAPAPSSAFTSTPLNPEMFRRPR